jgi:hypothetical protein
MHSQTSVFQPTPPAPSAFSTLRQSIGIGPSKAFPQPTPHAAKVSVTTKRVLVYYTEIPMDYLPISEENMKDKDTMKSIRIVTPLCYALPPQWDIAKLLWCPCNQDFIS